MRSIAGALLGAALLAAMLVSPAAAHDYGGGITGAELIGSVQGDGDSEFCANTEVATGVGAAEIAAYSKKTHQLFVTNGANDRIDVIDVSDPSDPKIVSHLDVGGGINSVAVSPNGRILAAAVAGEEVDDNGYVRIWILFKHRAVWRGDAEAGPLPDMVTFTPNGRSILVANEAEPNDEYTVDPEGSVSIINPWHLTTKTADFRHFNGMEDELAKSGVRIFGPGATVAQDLEPEYITVDPTSRYAFVTLQENNGLAVVDIRRAKVKAVVGLGFKDWEALGLELDASNKDDGISFQTWPVLGMYQPDAIDSFVAGKRGKKLFLITGNEGDARDYDGFSEEVRVEDLLLDPTAYPDTGEWAPEGELQNEEYLGRLRVTDATGDTDGDGDIDQIYAYGGRSFSIWNARTGELVYDSGDEIEKITAKVFPDDGDLFNSGGVRNESTLFSLGDDCDEIDNEFDDRSDDKGPEPEGLTVGEVGGRTYAFIGLERVGGVMVYDVTHPGYPKFVDYLTNPGILTDKGLTGDVGPEGLLFIPEYDSPSGKDLLVVTHEVTGTTSIWAIDS